MGLDKSPIEFKLAKSSTLLRNLAKQIVICYTAADQTKVKKVINNLKLDEPDARPLVVVDTRAAKKKSASNS